MWQIMLCCAWSNADDDRLYRLFMDLVGPMLPCKRCRDSYPKHVRKLASGTRHDWFKWVYRVKDKVNQSLYTKSIDFEDLQLRYELHENALDDVAVGDLLVLLSLDAHDRDEDDTFVEFCLQLACLLSLPRDSQMLQALASVSRPIVNSALRVSRAARVERGLAPLPLRHFKSIMARA